MLILVSTVTRMLNIPVEKAVQMLHEFLKDADAEEIAAVFEFVFASVSKVDYQMMMKVWLSMNWSMELKVS